MSTRTTYFGPRVSFRTTLADPGPVHVEGDSNSTFSWAGPLTIGGAQTISGAATFSGTVTATGAVTASGGLTASGALTSTSTFDQDALTSVFLSKQTTASYTSLTLADGELTVGAVSVSSAVIYFRSGVTTYQFWADAGTIL